MIKTGEIWMTFMDYIDVNIRAVISFLNFANVTIGQGWLKGKGSLY